MQHGQRNQLRISAIPIPCESIHSPKYGAVFSAHGVFFLYRAFHNIDALACTIFAQIKKMKPL